MGSNPTLSASTGSTSRPSRPARIGLYQGRYSFRQQESRGEVLEWPNRRDWKSRVVCIGRPWVRIPPSPPSPAKSLNQDVRHRARAVSRLWKRVS